MLRAIIFSFFHDVFYPFPDKPRDLWYIWIVVCKYFQFEQVYFFFSFGKKRWDIKVYRASWAGRLLIVKFMSSLLDRDINWPLKGSIRVHKTNASHDPVLRSSKTADHYKIPVEFTPLLWSKQFACRLWFDFISY